MDLSVSYKFYDHNALLTKGEMLTVNIYDVNILKYPILDLSLFNAIKTIYIKNAKMFEKIIFPPNITTILDNSLTYHNTTIEFINTNSLNVIKHNFLKGYQGSLNFPIFSNLQTIGSFFLSEINLPNLILDLSNCNNLKNIGNYFLYKSQIDQIKFPNSINTINNFESITVRIIDISLCNITNIPKKFLYNSIVDTLKDFIYFRYNHHLQK
jgi:hypothetical protein